MRFSGLAIQDAVTLEHTELVLDEKLKLDNVVTSRQKIVTHVSVKGDTVGHYIRERSEIERAAIIWNLCGPPTAEVHRIIISRWWVRAA